MKIENLNLAKIDTLIIDLGYKNKKLIVELKNEYGMKFEQNLLNYLIHYRKEIAKE